MSTAGPALADDNQFLQTATCADLLISPAREPNAEHKDREHGHHDTDFEAVLARQECVVPSRARTRGVPDAPDLYRGRRLNNSLKKKDFSAGLIFTGTRI